MKVLGVGTPYPHDPSAAIYVDGKLVAAAEEERFTREKHAEFDLTVHSVRFCLKQAGLKPDDIDIVAFPWSYEWYQARRWKSFRRLFFPYISRAFKSVLKSEKVRKNSLEKLYGTLKAAGFDTERVRVEFVPHHIAHAAASYFPSGFKRAAFMSFDGSGEFTAGILGTAEGKSLRVVKEWIWPDSLGALYTTFTEYCGFERNEGEYKLMGMAPFGKTGKIDFSGVATVEKGDFKVHSGYYHAPHHERYRNGMNISRKLVRRWGPPREGDDLTEPHTHIACETQELFEKIAIQMVESHLSDELKLHGRLCFSGGCALNVSLNRKLINHPLIKELWVVPAAGDAGTPLGAAAYVAAGSGDEIEPMRHPYLGPEYSNEEIESAIKKKSFCARKDTDICRTAAGLLQRGEIVGWFQGRMEFGPRALGNRSILGNPTVRGTADRINAIVKFREQWRPFCPSLIRELAPDFILNKHPSPFMTFSFEVNPVWRSKVPEVVHVDGTARPQYVNRDTNPRFYSLIEHFHRLSGVPIVINTSLNRRGEPMACSPDDALDMFEGCGLGYLALGDWLVSKK
ncbi:MAG: carbamoyltransferase [Candidatus Omnitrophica bacterium]|nr:carbamoyltransferase [Candidatus Omnitrophota bacterium]